MVVKTLTLNFRETKNDQCERPRFMTWNPSFNRVSF